MGSGSATVCRNASADAHDRQRPTGCCVARRGAILLAWACVFGSGLLGSWAEAGYPQRVLVDEPVAYWRLDEASGSMVRNAAAALSTSGNDSGDGLRTAIGLLGEVVGRVQLGQPGPQPPRFDDFAADNTAARFGAAGAYIRVADPGADSPLDFSNGDSITLEAWIDLEAIGRHENVYIVGKGRTHRDGTLRDNQNYALRVRDVDGGGARLSFLFRSAGTQSGAPADWHRWTSQAAILPGSGWHHVVVAYTFGKPESLRAYIDGVATAGSWDMGGATTAPPVVDDDELWIGSSMGGQPSSTFRGRIDEVALYRVALPEQRVKDHFRARPVEVRPAVEPPPGMLVVEIVEGVPDQRSWSFEPPPAQEHFFTDVFAFSDLPRKYNPRGILADRTNPFLLRATGRVALPAGEYRVLIRGKGATRLLVDGQVVLQTEFPSQDKGAHHRVPDLPPALAAGLRLAPVGHVEQHGTLALDGGEHEFRLESLIGGRTVKSEAGELSVSLARGDEPFQLLSLGRPWIHSDEGWEQFARRWAVQVEQLNTQRRRAAAAQEDAYWQQRHAAARRYVATLPPVEVPAAVDGMPAHNAIDHFVNARLRQAGIAPAALVDDLTFLRRLTLDTVGVIPTPEEIAQFLADEPALRRARAIERLVNDPRWADHWVAYWQDVLAENPGILKPTLNNTGPFRFWLHEAFSDNLALDRFVTELILMDGSRYGGGPAGFGIATENDSPLAAKAHILSRAFLGIDLGCARCHDAPYHPWKQEHTFALAALLGRGPVAVPATSSVNLEAALRKPLVEVTLRPGTKVGPRWPFPELVDALPPELLRESDDPRRHLAALVTSPGNRRFAEVAVNRLWQRYLGRGLVDDPDDWFQTEPSHPELLAFLARELVSHDYDLKHVARLIFASHTYQRAIAPTTREEDARLLGARLFAWPTRRRMTAEQLLDSLFVAAGKEFGAEELTFDPDNRQPVHTFLNLGVPRRAWQLTSLSNERDRPALSLPVAQSLVDLLEAYGWRASRPNPLTPCDVEPTPLQPLLLANGVASTRVCRLSDDGALVQLCLQARGVDELVDALCMRILTRPATPQERAALGGALHTGFAQRIVPDAPLRLPRRRTTNVAWSNHLSPEATRIKLELEEAARQGDPPTARLQPEWRQRAEDVIWALVNSPEFVFVP